MAPSKKTPFVAETFNAVSASGENHRLKLWQYKIEQPMLSGPPAITFANWKIESTDGRHVNAEQDGSMSFADTGEKLSRVA